MDYKATLMVLVLVSSTLAGCTGDPDGGGGDEIDSDALQDLFDEHFQDFLNNTTITVNNHYHNNTTYVIDDSQYTDITNNDYNNTTNIDGGEVNNYFEEYDYSQDNYSIGGGGAGGNGSGGLLYLLDIQFSLEDLMPGYIPIDHRNNTLDYTYTYYDGLMNNYTTEVFTIQCSDYYLVGSQSSSGTAYTYWQSYQNYADLWVNLYNQTISEMLQYAAWDQWNLNGLHDYHTRMACDENFNASSGFYDLFLFDVPIPAGMALSGINENNFVGLHEYVWGYEQYTSIYNSGCYSWYPTSMEMGWIEDYPPTGWCEYWDISAFNVDFEFETIDWGYGNGGWVGGDENSVLTVSVNNIYPGYEYRLIAYFTYAPVVPLE